MGKLNSEAKFWNKFFELFKSGLYIKQSFQRSYTWLKIYLFQNSHIYLPIYFVDKTTSS